LDLSAPKRISLVHAALATWEVEARSGARAPVELVAGELAGDGYNMRAIIRHVGGLLCGADDSIFGHDIS
jgi:hypothetical protein